MNSSSRPYAWVPSLYLAEALPYVAVMIIATTMYKRMGLSNTELALYTSWLYLPWVIKPLWSPFIAAIKDERWWVLLMQLLIGAGFAGIAFTLPTTFWLQGSLAFFWILAFASATHDIAADGLYILGLSSHDQSLYVGIRSTFYRIGNIFGQGLLVIFAGWLERSQTIPMAWSISFFVLAGFFLALWLWHQVTLPKPLKEERTETNNKSLLLDFWLALKTFFTKPHIVSDEGDDYVLITTGLYGKVCDNVARILSEKGYKGKVICLTVLKPLNTSDIMDAIGNSRYVFTGEEGILSGGFGESLKLELTRAGYTGRVDNFAIEDQMIRAGTVQQQLQRAGLDAQSVSSRIEAVITEAVK